MGKDWLYWVLGGKGKSSGKRRRVVKMEEAAAASSAGCMCAVFQIFDLQHHLDFPLNHPQHQQDEQPIVASLKQDDVLEIHAPRNSLELDEELQKPTGMEQLGSEANAAAAIMKQVQQEKEGYLNLPVGMHIKTRLETTSSSPRISTRSRMDDISSECSNYGYANSPAPSSAATTPTLVARLMGLDILPDSSSSPSFSNSKTPKISTYQRKDGTVLHNRTKTAAFSDDDISVGARSVPETPRLSSARRSDVEYHHHRLSLQINKENRTEEFGVVSKLGRRGRRFRGTEDENRGGGSSSYSSPGHFAKQIVRQVKESVSRRRVGLMDITNQNNNLEEEEEPVKRRDENLILHKPKNSIIVPNFDVNPGGKVTPPSCSPRLRFLETNKTKQIPTNSVPTKSPRLSQPASENDSPLRPKTPLVKHQKIPLPTKVTEHAIITRNNNKKDEQFVRPAAAEKKKNKKTPLLSSDILSISGPTLLPVKKAPATKLLSPQKQQLQLQSQESDAVSSKRITQLSRIPFRPYSHHHDQIFPAVPPGGAAVEYKVYINRILRRAGAKWKSSSHPLDPSIFHYLELFHPATAGSGGVLSRRSNRKLTFQLVDELLAEMLKPHCKPWNCAGKVNEKDVPLVDQLCEKVLSFPEAKCEVLEDIDALIDLDFRPNVVEEEVERLVCEMEGEMIESLLCETVAVVFGGGRTAEERRGTDVT